MDQELEGAISSDRSYTAVLSYTDETLIVETHESGSVAVNLNLYGSNAP